MTGKLSICQIFCFLLWVWVTKLSLIFSFYDFSKLFSFSFFNFSEDCSCYGYRFQNHQKGNPLGYNITYFAASEIPECAVVRVSEDIGEGDFPVVLQYTLQKDAERVLTQGGKTALRSLYESIPVHSSINIDKFISHHGLGYCDTFANDSTAVLACVDDPYFYISVNTRKNRDALTPTELFLLKYGVSIAFCILLLVTPSVASAYKHKHV